MSKNRVWGAESWVVKPLGRRLARVGLSEPRSTRSIRKRVSSGPSGHEDEAFSTGISAVSSLSSAPPQAPILTSG